MSRNEHLISTICQDQHTKEKALSIYRLARTKTGPGSGRDIGQLSTGLPAVCSYLASQRLNKGDVKRMDAQIASCLKKADFEKVLTIVTAIVDELDVRPAISYRSLYKHYKPPVEFHVLEQYFNQVENTLVMLNIAGFKSDTPEGIGAIFHWVCVAAGCKGLPFPMVFAKEMEIPHKKFMVVTERLNTKCTNLRAEIASGAKSRPSSPTKLPAVTCSPSKRTLRVLPSKDSPRKLATTSSELPVPQKLSSVNIPTPQRKPPLKRPLRQLPSKDSPKKQVDPFQSEPEDTDALPTIVVSPSKSSPAKRTLHELPSRDSSKKTAPSQPEMRVTADIEMASPSPAVGDNASNDMDVDEIDFLSAETPTKKRRTESPTKPTTRQSSALPRTLFSSAPSTLNTNETTDQSTVRITRSATSTLQSPQKPPTSPRKSILSSPKKQPPSSPQKPVPSTPRKQQASPQKRTSRASTRIEVDVAMDAPSSESEDEAPTRARRFRPVYLDQRQWLSRDRRVVRMWKKAERLTKEMAGLDGYHSGGKYAQ